MVRSRIRETGLLLVTAAFLVEGVGCNVPPAAEEAAPAETASEGARLEGPTDGEFRTLTEGETLQGWVQVLDSDWEIDNGTVRSRQDPEGRLEGESWLLTRETYRDFVLRLKFRITPGGNSGVFVRDPVPALSRLTLQSGGTPPWEAGYEVNINNDAPNYPTGSVWALAKGPPGLQKEGEWNDLEIRIEGYRIWTWVNGKPALEGAELPPRSREGSIGFQRHGGEAYREKLIELKDVEIRRL